MIQRPQSFFLCLIPITMVTIFFAPIWIKPTITHTYTLYVWYFQEADAMGNPLHTLFFPYTWMGCLAVMIAGIALYEVFRHDNRAVQLKLGLLNTLLMILLIGVILYVAIQKETHLYPTIAGQYKLGFILPAVSIMSNLIANRFIKKDEQLVKSIDSIR